MYLFRSRCDTHKSFKSLFRSLTLFESFLVLDFWHVFGCHVANPTPQDLKAVRSSSYLGFRVITGEAFSSSEKMNL